jgi:hypothetical protein
LTILDAIRPNCLRENDPFEVEKGGAFTLFTGYGIADFYLFGILKPKLQGIDESDDEELKNEIRKIFQGIPSDEPKKSFDHSIERCQWVAANAGNYSPS